MPEKHKNTLMFNRAQMSLKIPFVIYKDAESLLEKITTCYNSPEESYTTKVIKYIACGYSLFTQSSFDSNKNKHDFGRVEGAVKKFCKHATIQKTRMLSPMQRNIYDRLTENEKHHRIRDHCRYAGEYRELRIVSFKDTKKFLHSVIMVIMTTT